MPLKRRRELRSCASFIAGCVELLLSNLLQGLMTAGFAFLPEEFQVVLRGRGLTLVRKTSGVTCTYQVNGTTIRKCPSLRYLP